MPPYFLPYLEQLIEDNPGAMVSVIDRREVICFASPAAYELFGYRPEEFVGRPFFDFFSPMDVTIIRLALEAAVLYGESVDFTRHVKLKGGGTRCMRGPAKAIIDRATGEIYELAVAYPVDAIV